MATANLNGARVRADHPGRIAPITPKSAADLAAFAAARGDIRRPQASNAGWFPSAAEGDHPSQEDEALRRVREHRDALREGLAAAREYADREYAASVAA
jgi:hypothetical protein